MAAESRQSRESNTASKSRSKTNTTTAGSLPPQSRLRCIHFGICPAFYLYLSTSPFTFFLWWPRDSKRLHPVTFLQTEKKKLDYDFFLFPKTQKGLDWKLSLPAFPSSLSSLTQASRRVPHWPDYQRIIFVLHLNKGWLNKLKTKRRRKWPANVIRI